jgi:predicted metal-dependent RNase
MDGFVRPPRRIFVNHGEEEAALAFAEFLREKYKETVEVPEFGQEFILS